jgi:hypothetical protein
MRSIGREHVEGRVKCVSERDCIRECSIVIESGRPCVVICDPNNHENRLPLPLPLPLFVPDEGNKGER